MTQAVVSHGMQGLRQHVDGLLFVRDGRRLLPSEVARRTAATGRTLPRTVMAALRAQRAPLGTPALQRA